jgi:hypothetical protein
MPIFIPSKERLRITVELKYKYPETPENDMDREERLAFRERLETWISTEMTNLDGFSIFDATHRYRITLPPGWKTLGKNADVGNKSPRD